MLDPDARAFLRLVRDGNREQLRCLHATNGATVAEREPLRRVLLLRAPDGRDEQQVLVVGAGLARLEARVLAHGIVRRAEAVREWHQLRALEGSLPFVVRVREAHDDLVLHVLPHHAVAEDAGELGRDGRVQPGPRDRLDRHHVGRVNAVVGPLSTIEHQVVAVLARDGGRSQLEARAFFRAAQHRLRHGEHARTDGQLELARGKAERVRIRRRPRRHRHLGHGTRRLALSAARRGRRTLPCLAGRAGEAEDHERDSEMTHLAGSRRGFPGAAPHVNPVDSPPMVRPPVDSLKRR